MKDIMHPVIQEGPQIKKDRKGRGTWSRELDSMEYGSMALKDTAQSFSSVCAFWRYAYLHTINLKFGGYKRLLILSHMRSGSSLLVHLLASNPDILGYGELHLALRDNDYKRKMALKIFGNRERSRFPGLYLMDKLLHNDLTKNASIWTDPNVLFILLLREPTRAFPSIMELPYYHNDEAGCAAYYSGRIERMVEHAEAIGGRDRAFFLTWRQLIFATQTCFTGLERFLNLKTSLSESYEIYTTTGKEGVGDFSSNIQAGHIIREHTPKASPFDQSPYMKDLLENYLAGKEKLEKFCQTPVFSEGEDPSASGGFLEGASS